MFENRIWELLSRQFNKEISESELEELQRLIRESGSEGLSPELLMEIQRLDLKTAEEDETRRKRSLAAIQKAIRAEQSSGSQSPGSQSSGSQAPGNQASGSQSSASLASPEQSSIGQAARQISAEQSSAEQEADEPATTAEVLRPVRWRRPAMFSAAACLIVFAGYYLLKKSNGSGRAVEQFETIVTRAGSKTFINLPDSSTVLLNSACNFRYNKTYGTIGREIELAGEAYFDIRKSAEVPLVVHAGNVVIRVLGTAFDVKANPDDSFVEATLIRGVIEVSLLTDPERKILLRPNEKIVIRKNQDLPLGKTRDTQQKNKDAVIAVTKVAPDPIDSSVIETIWTKNKMLFHKEHFGSLARKMERWYNVSFVLTDTSLNEMVFTGSLEKESLAEALNALQHVAHFNYSIDGQTVTIRK